MDKARKYAVNREEEEQNDTLAPLASGPNKFGGIGMPKLGNPSSAPKIGRNVRMSLMGGVPMSRGKGMRPSVMHGGVSNKVRQSAALFSRGSVMIKPSMGIQKNNMKRMSTMPLSFDSIKEDIPQSSPGRLQKPMSRSKTRTSVFGRIAEARDSDYKFCGPVVDFAFAYYDYWEYYTLMIFLYLLSMFCVFNPFSKEVCGDWPCFPGAALDIAPARAVFLLIAKWTAAALYVLFAELVFIYSRVFLGHFQMSALHMYVPYLVCGYHDAHKVRGWCFVGCAIVHTIAHLIRVAMDAKMPTQLWVSGGFLVSFVCFIMVLASRNFNFCCFKARWARAWLRNKMKWEVMRAIHLVGCVGMLVAAWWHRFPDGESPLKVTFPNRFFTLFLAITCVYLTNRVLLWKFTEQIDVVTHTVYGSCQLVVIKEFPFARDFCSHGRAWFSADAKIMFPDVDSREWHPFTCVVNSATGQGFMLIKNYGDWSGYFSQMPASFIYMRTPCIRMSVAIPAQYTSVLVVASGTFITTVAGTVARAIALGDEDDDAATQDITIVWIDREPIMIALVCMRLLSEFTNTNFKIYCTAKQKDVASHLSEVTIMSTAAANVELEKGDAEKGNIEENVNSKMANMTMDPSDDGDAPTDVLSFLESCTEDYPNIDVHVGRPPMDELFDELEPDFVFCGAAPPVARGVLDVAQKRGVAYRTTSYL